MSDSEKSEETRQRDRPKEILDLEEEVAGVLDAAHIKREDDVTISAVVRDYDSGEVLAESYLQRVPGVYAFVRVTRDPENPEEYENEREEPPEWVDYVRKDPPLEHFVTHIRCASCESDTYINQTTHKAVSPIQWERVPHAGDCEHASEADQRRAEEQALADEIRGRPSPSRMALTCIYEEVHELRELEGEDEFGLLIDPIHERYARIRTALEDRLNPRYPECPECGADLDEDWEGVVECTECYEFGPDAEVEEAYHKQLRRVWGWRGHGGREPGRIDDV